MADRIRWTPEEIKAVHDKAIALLGDVPDMAIYKAVSISQTVLPEDRRRNILHIGSIPPKLLTLINETLGYEDNSQELEIDKLKETIRELRSYITTLEARPKPKTEVEVLTEFLSNVLVETQRKLNIPALAPKAANMEDVAEVVQQRHRPEPTDAGRPWRPSIVVIGPIREQRQTLLQMYDDKVNLKVFSGEDIKGRERLVSGVADKVIVWTKFCSHSTSESIPKEKLVLAPTLFAVREVIDNIIEKGLQ